MRRLLDDRNVRRGNLPPPHTGGRPGTDDAQRGGSQPGPNPERPRLRVWHRSRTIPLPGALALFLVVPVLVAVGVATIGLFAAGMAGLLSAPRLLRRGRGGAGRRDAGARPTIVLDRADYRRTS